MYITFINENRLMGRLKMMYIKDARICQMIRKIDQLYSVVSDYCILLKG